MTTIKEPGRQTPDVEDQQYDVRRQGAYSGAASLAVGFVPGRLRGPLLEAGGMAMLLGSIVWSAVRYPRGYWSAVLDDMYQTIKRSWVPISLAIFGFMIFISTMSAQYMHAVGATHLFGPMVFQQALKTFVIWINAIVVAGVIGAALTADVGSRKVRDEIDAMRVMGINPVRELAVPRVMSLTLFMTFLCIPSALVCLLALQFGALYVVGMPATDFYQNVFDSLSPIPLVALVINSLITGVLIGTVCCYKGFVAGGGAVGLGRAVNHAVVIAFVAVFVEQLFYQALIVGLFPDVGAFR